MLPSLAISANSAASSNISECELVMWKKISGTIKERRKNGISFPE